MSKSEKKRLIKQIEEILNTEIPGTPRIGGRVMYIPLPGTGSTARHILSPRAQQVFSFLKRLHQGGTSAQIQKGLKVNRNVVAGAVHELKVKRAIQSRRLQVGSRQPREQVAAEVAPKKRRSSK